MLQSKSHSRRRAADGENHVKWQRDDARRRGLLFAAMTLLALARVVPIGAHGTEARRVVEMAWKRDRITRVLGVSRSELGLNGSKAPEQLITIGGRACIFGDLFAFDVDDRYAFDIDEAVDVTVTYAPERTERFTVAWDKNGGDGYGLSNEIA